MKYYILLFRELQKPKISNDKSYLEKIAENITGEIKEFDEKDTAIRFAMDYWRDHKTRKAYTYEMWKSIQENKGMVIEDNYIPFAEEDNEIVINFNNDENLL